MWRHLIVHCNYPDRFGRAISKSKNRRPCTRRTTPNRWIRISWESGRKNIFLLGKLVSSTHFSRFPQFGIKQSPWWESRSPRILKSRLQSKILLLFSSNSIIVRSSTGSISSTSSLQTLPIRSTTHLQTNQSLDLLYSLGVVARCTMSQVARYTVSQEGGSIQSARICTAHL